MVQSLAAVCTENKQAGEGATQDDTPEPYGSFES